MGQLEKQLDSITKVRSVCLERIKPHPSLMNRRTLFSLPLAAIAAVAAKSLVWTDYASGGLVPPRTPYIVGEKPSETLCLKSKSWIPLTQWDACSWKNSD